MEALSEAEPLDGKVARPWAESGSGAFEALDLVHHYFYESQPIG